MWSLQHISYATTLAITIIGVNAGSQDSGSSQCASSSPVDINWYPPNQTMINNLSTVLNGTGIYGYIFNNSQTPPAVPYSTYNWCNMPHVRANEYVIPPAEYQLAYVEVIHRHHKRTPYQSNTFPIESQSWLCDDESLYYYGSPYPDNQAAQIAWSISQSPTNPFKPSGFQNSTCQFPQITSGGLYDSRQHGADLRTVYHDTLHFLPNLYDPKRVTFRVTNNVITSQVASQIAIGLYPNLAATRLRVTVQPTGVDSLEPQYTCSAASASYSSYGVGSKDAQWQAHLNASQTKSLFSQLDAVSGVNASSSDWHNWFDHYFDNLSAKLCHGKSLPCNISNSSLCVTNEIADAVFRRGLYEYSYIYRDNSNSLAAAVGSFGVYMAELAANLRAAMSGSSSVLYHHNVAHDGSLSRLLSILQVDQMVWPGMGSEAVFELWRGKSTGCWFLRVLWKGQVLRSSNPTLGRIDMLPVEKFLGYVDGLVGVNAAKVPGLCSGK